MRRRDGRRLRAYPGCMEPYGFLGAYLRYDRAKEHLARLRDEASAFRSEWRDVGDLLWTVQEGTLAVDIRDVEVPEHLSIRAGEVISNMRSALDYLVFALAWHDSGRRPTGSWARGLQFPVYSGQAQFDRAARRRLRGLNDEHVRLVARFQPFAGCRFTGELADLSNEDKHRHLLYLVGRLDLSREWRDVTEPLPGAEPDDHGRYPAEDLSIQTLAQVEVALADGRPLTETRESLARDMGALMNVFAAEFTLAPIQGTSERWA